ncbi:hypothetical protein F66182_8259 [Fusarium sp. NRRL 66182]|nr:hypothetical protein F66182_8259 [Fusarium sp. NRRL 66182]
MSDGRFRPLLPSPSRGGPSGSRPPPPKMNIPKRTSVKLACQACRQRKAKCDGHRPKCSACIGGGRECQYASHPFEAEAVAMKRKHDDLKERMMEHENLYASLQTRESQEAEEILRRIRVGKDVKAVTEDIQRGSLMTQMTCPTTKAPLSRNDSIMTVNSTATSNSASSPTYSSQRRFSFAHTPQARLASPYDHPGHIFEETGRDTQHTFAEDGIVVDLPGNALPLSRWTSVYQDDKLLNHLLLLFWTWDTACNHIIDRTTFEDDLKNLDPATPSASFQLCFCSPFLVNALLAVSCLYTTNSTTFDTPGNSSTRGLMFAKEAVKCLRLEDTRPSLPVAQGLALMYAYEAALGDGETALEFHSLMQTRYVALRLDDVQRSTDTAIAGLRQRTEAHALSWIQWGFYVWDWKPMHGLCRRLVIKKPNRPKTWQEDSSPLNRKESPEYWWFPYPVSIAPQQSLKRDILEAQCRFTVITEQVLEFLIPLEQGVPPSQNAGRALGLYSNLMDWKFKSRCVLLYAYLLTDQLPFSLSVDLVAISILRPFEHISKEAFGPFDPCSISYQHACNAMSTIWHFRALYTLRNEYWIIQVASVCAFRVLSAIEASPIQLETFIKACRALMDLGEYFPVAQKVLHSIESVVKKRHVQLPSYAKDQLPNGGDDGVPEFAAVKVRGHSVTVERDGLEGEEDRLTMTGLLSALTPDDGLDYR